MKFYLAPMESMTGYIFRNVYQKHFGNVDKYFTPFISSSGLNHKELNDILPEHNVGMEVVPQILTNHADVFLELAKRMQEYGYRCVNLNLGCPSGTVVAKKRGSGFLAFPEELERFLDEIFEKSPVKISIKTRIGKNDVDEWGKLQEIYNRFPMEELIIHPRLQKDQYRLPVHMDVFEQALEGLNMPVCYNGDLHTTAQYREFVERFPKTDTVMLGRGVFKNPGLIDEMQGKEALQPDKLKQFMDDLLSGYEEIMSGDLHTLFKMKEVWVYLSDFVPGEEKLMKRIKKSNSTAEYKAAVNELWGRILYGKNVS